MRGPLGGRGILSGALGVTPVISLASNWYEAGGATDCVGAYDAATAASYAASKINLVNADLPLLDTAGALNWAAGTGWSGFAALTRYLNTRITPVSGCTVIVKYAGATVGNSLWLVGSLTTGAIVGLLPYRAAGNVQYFNGGNIIVAPQLVTGNLAVSGQAAYRNGIPESGTISVWTGTSSSAFFIGCCSQSNAPLAGTYTSASISSAWIGTTTQSQPVIAALVAAMP